jgi:glycosyltransferase involved in cell wall biosynthesis
LQQHYLDARRKATRYVPNGGMLRERKEPRKILEWGLEAGRYVLFLGRFSPEKGCHLLVEAFEQIETDATLVMAGAASYCDEYSRELRRHAGERIRMLDWVWGEALDELLTNAMIFVLPSEMEGLSLALLDAMAAGRCVLASDVPENREAVEGAGFVFRCGDAQDLAERLRYLMANPAVREAAGKAAAKRVRERYLWQGISETIEQAYFELCGRKSVEVMPKKPGSRQKVSEHGRRRAG